MSIPTKEKLPSGCTGCLWVVGIIVIGFGWLMWQGIQDNQRIAETEKQKALVEQQVEDKKLKAQTEWKNQIATYWHIDLAAQEAVLDRFRAQRERPYSAAVESWITKGPILVEGCISDVVQGNGGTRPTRVVVDDCRRFHIRNSIKYQLYTYGEAAEVAIKDNNAHEPFFVVAQIERVKGIVDGNSYHSVYEAEGELKELQPAEKPSAANKVIENMDVPKE